MFFSVCMLFETFETCFFVSLLFMVVVAPGTCGSTSGSSTVLDPCSPQVNPTQSWLDCTWQGHRVRWAAVIAWHWLFVWPWHEFRVSVPTASKGDELSDCPGFKFLYLYLFSDSGGQTPTIFISNHAPNNLPQFWVRVWQHGVTWLLSWLRRARLNRQKAEAVAPKLEAREVNVLS